MPAAIRRKLGIGPGPVLEWEEEADRIVVRKAGRYCSEDIHRALFRETPAARSLDDLNDALRRNVRARHARR